MNHFHGDLLMGGVRLRDLDGEIEEDFRDDKELWSGQFRIEDSQECYFEVGRPYLLILEDGRSGRVEVTNIDHTAMLVRFRPALRPK